MDSVRVGDRVGMVRDLDTVCRVEGEYAYFAAGGGWRIEKMLAAGEWFHLPRAAERLTDEAAQHAIDTARHVVGHDNTTDREIVLAQGLINAQGEGDRLGSLLDSLPAFASLRAGDQPRDVLAELLTFIDQHRVAK